MQTPAVPAPPSSVPVHAVPTAQLWTAGLLAGVLAAALNIVLALVLTPVLSVPSSFAPFQPLTIAVSSVVGCLLATLVYVVLRRFIEQPDSTFKVLSLFALIASFLLPLYIGNSLSERFAGVTLEKQLALGAMHVITAACAVTLLLRRARAS